MSNSAADADATSTVLSDIVHNTQADISAPATDSHSVKDASGTSEAIQGTSTGNPEPNNAMQIMSFPEHMEHTIALLDEANWAKFESGYYHLYNWVLSHFADRDSDIKSGTIKEDPIRITPWPQARLNGIRPDPKSETEPDLSEYPPPRDRKKPALTQGTPTVPAFGRKSERLKLKLQETAQKAVVGKLTKKKGRARKDKKLKDLEDEKARHPDFLNSILFASKIFGIHSLVENKRLLTFSPDSKKGQDVTKRAADIAAAFADLNVQIMETVVCAFHAYSHHTTITYLITVGYYFRTIRFERNSMPPDDFNWNMRPTAKKERIQEWIERNHPGKVYHLLNYPKNDDYSLEFRAYWDEALGDALEDLRNAVSKNKSIPAVEDLTDSINDELEVRRRGLLGLDSNRGNARAGPSRLR